MTILADLVDGFGARIIGDPTAPIAALAYDSRQVSAGTLFFALSGQNHDGHEFVGRAVESGAVAAVVSRPVDIADLRAQVIVADVRRFMGPVAHRFYGDPTAAMKLAGITGTNGKTTTAYIVHHVLEAIAKAGLVGTIEYRLGGEQVPAVRTTPESVDLARALAAMRAAGCWAASMEVSSHALDQGRADGCHFDVVAFTNLSQDHLDYHGSMEEYFEAKRSLFADPEPDCVRIVNVDDEAGARLISEGLADMTYGLDEDATLSLNVIEADTRGTRVSFTGLGLDGRQVDLPLVGSHNASNACCAAAICRALEVEPSVVLDRLATVPQIPGRLERIDEGQPFAVFVDYAHTPDGLASVIPAVRDFTDGRVLVVFGCGGDRDRAKRPMMGETAARLADTVYVTSDNPRSERPDAIIDDILVGVRRVAEADAEFDADRRHAISVAFADARPGDTVLIAGKGHETGQQVGDDLIPFDDRQVARELLADLEATT